MKVLGAATWAWWCMMMMMMMLVVFMPSMSLGRIVTDECGEQLGGYNRVVFDVANAKDAKPGCYSKFLTRFRNLVEAPTRVCGIQSTRASPIPRPENEYITVDLKINSKKWVTLAIDVIDLYIWGYQDKFNGTFRANFVSDAPQDIRDKLFNATTTIKRSTTFASDYTSLQRYANIGRNELPLGLHILYDAITSVYGTPGDELDGSTEAKFILIAIQMVSEAARFKFMEQPIRDNVNTDEVRYKRVCFQNNWSKISKALYDADRAEPVSTKCTNFKNDLVVSNHYFRETYYNVDEIISWIGLVKYTEPTFNLAQGLNAPVLGSDAIM
ncbi:Antiviral protein MAP [Bienertia sinuspersici]